jgi:hypothetical protein
VPDVHVPKLDEHGAKSALKITFEIVMISVGVFLGLAGEQWREARHQRELADQALRRFQAEIVENRKAIAAVKDYHLDLRKRFHTEFDKPPGQRNAGNVSMQGIRPAPLDHAAWDLAIATQSLSYIDPALSLSLSQLYNTQATVVALGNGLLQSMYVQPPIDDARATTFFGAVMLYYDDMAVYEPKMISLYDEALQQIDKALK